MDVGTVFIWKNFPDPRDPNSKHKTRWFIYLGKTSIYNFPVFIYICTTTTKLHYYESGGGRSNHLIIKYKKGQYGFEENCILDIDMNFYGNITEDRFLKLIKNNIIVEKGRPPENELRRIYKLILKSKTISKKVKLDIHKSLNLAGITNLKKP